MSLNKFIDYDTNSILDAELKVKKLGLKDATDNKCLFISNTGDKEIIARDITTSDIPGNIPVGSLTVTTTGTTGAATFLSNNLNIPEYQGGLTLTTTGSSGAATLSNDVLNIPQYTGGGGGGSLTLTTTGTSGAATLVNDALNIPQYQGDITLTTTGTSGAATLVNNTLNIPQYTGGTGGGGNFQTYTMTSPYTLPIGTAANTTYDVINTTTNQFFGTDDINFTNLLAGDRINIEVFGTYTNSNTTSDTFRYVRMYFGTAALEWDTAADNDAATVWYNLNTAAQARHFKSSFQIIAKTDWDATNNNIELAVSGTFASTAYDNNSDKSCRATYRLKSGTIPQASLGGTGTAPLKMAYNTGNLNPPATGFNLVYQGINTAILKGYQAQ